MKQVWQLMALLLIASCVTARAGQIDVRAGYDITLVTNCTATSWSLYGTVEDSAITGFTGLDCTTGMMVACETTYGDIDLYVITTIQTQTYYSLRCIVEYDQAGTPRVGAPQVGQQALCAITDYEAILPPDPTSTRVSPFLYYGIVNESLKRIATNTTAGIGGLQAQTNLYLWADGRYPLTGNMNMNGRTMTNWVLADFAAISDHPANAYADRWHGEFDGDASLLDNFPFPTNWPAYTNLYLWRDGHLSMTGALNMGGKAISNVTEIGMDTEGLGATIDFSNVSMWGQLLNVWDLSTASELYIATNTASAGQVLKSDGANKWYTESELDPVFVANSNSYYPRTNPSNYWSGAAVSNRLAYLLLGYGEPLRMS